MMIILECHRPFNLFIFQTYREYSMNSLIFRIFITCLFTMLSHTALAEEDDISIVGSVSYNWKNEDFTIGGKPFKPEFTTVDWSIIAAYKSAYVKVNFDQSIKDSLQIDNSSSGSTPDNQAIYFGRDDSVITLGYSAADNITVFAGYTRGVTEGVGTGQIIDEGTGPAFSTLTINITEKGPFVGASYSYYMKDSGSFSFVVAYAQLDGEVLLRSANTLIDTQVTTFNSQVANGDVDGLSYSISWSDYFAENIQYYISLKQTDYKFDVPEVAGEDSFDFDDTYLALSIGLSKFFQFVN